MRTPWAGRWSANVVATTVAGLLAGSTAVAGERIRVASAEFELPKEVTPAVRAACEGDVRRFCVRKDSTASTVKVCVYMNFGKLNTKCQKLALQAGLSP